MEAESTPQQSDAIFDFLAWLDKNKKTALVGVGAVVVIIAGAAIYSWNKNSTEESANNALFTLPSGVASRKAMPSGEPYQKVADEYPGTSAGERAELMAAGFFFTDGKYDKAREAFEKFLADHADSKLSGQAAFGVAASLDAQGKADMALAKYQEVIQSHQGENVVSVANLSRARILESQGKVADAYKIYTDMQGPTMPNDAWKGEAAERREQLVAKHPELAPKPAAMTATPQDQVIEVTTPPEGSTNAAKVRVVPPEELKTNKAAKP